MYGKVVLNGFDNMGHSVSNGALDFLADLDASGDSWVVFSESNYPGWSATIDGIETDIYAANYLFQAIRAKRAEVQERGVKLIDLSIGEPRGPALLSARNAAARWCGALVCSLIQPSAVR